jgi:uncharacterized protein (TIGR03083 family)
MSDADLDHLTHLVRTQRAFADSIAAVDPRAAVPTCGRWDVTDLVEHLAEIHHWAAAMARSVDATPLERGARTLTEHYVASAHELATTLTELGPEAPARTLVGPGPASFWHRRQLHETLVHLWDLRTAAGTAPDVSPEVWADTVDEVVTVMQPRQVRLGRAPAIEVAVDLTATDVGTTWRLGPPDDPAAATVRAPAESLALLVWRRITPAHTALTCTGDLDRLHHVLGSALTP